MAPGRRDRGIGLLVVAVAVIAVALRGGGLPAAGNVAQVVAVVLAVPSLLVGLPAWWNPRSHGSTSPQQLELARATLFRLVREQWDEEIRIRQLDDVTRLAVRWRLTELAVMDRPERVDASRLRRTWFGLGRRVRFTGRSDRMGDVARRFRQLSRRRLVILGEPGSGKTTLAVLLLAELAREPLPGEPVPVLLSMAGWNPDAERVHRWLARQLTESYGALRDPVFGPDAAAALVAHREVLPVLDGLDELPADVRPRVRRRSTGRPRPPRSSSPAVPPTIRRRPPPAGCWRARRSSSRGPSRPPTPPPTCAGRWCPGSRAPGAGSCGWSGRSPAGRSRGRCRRRSRSGCCARCTSTPGATRPTCATRGGCRRRRPSPRSCSTTSSTPRSPRPPPNATPTTRSTSAAPSGPGATGTPTTRGGGWRSSPRT